MGRLFYDRETGMLVGRLHTFPVWECDAYQDGFALPEEDCVAFEQDCSCDEQTCTPNDEDAGSP